MNIVRQKHEKGDVYSARDEAGKMKMTSRETVPTRRYKNMKEHDKTPGPC